MRYTQYRPAFFDGFDAENGEVSTLAELLAVPFIASWGEEPSFHRFSVSEYESGKHTLLCELQEGRTWFVVAWVSEPFDELPRWPGAA